MKKLVHTIIFVLLIIGLTAAIFFSIRHVKVKQDITLQIDCNSRYILECYSSQYIRGEYKNKEVVINNKVAYTQDDLNKNYELIYYEDDLLKRFEFEKNYECLDFRIEKSISKQVFTQGKTEFVQTGNNKLNAKQCNDRADIHSLGVQKTNLLQYDKRYSSL